MALLKPFINLHHLYYFHWGFKKRSLDEATIIFEDLWLEQQKLSILEPQALYGYFACQSEKDTLSLYTSPKETAELCRFTFPRQSSGKRLCLADFFKSKTNNEKDVIALQVVTIGHKTAPFTKALFQNNEYRKYFFWHGFAVETTSALADMVHHHIRIGLGLEEKSPTVDHQKTSAHQGSRFSFGFPACPNLEDQQKILELLDAKQIGVSLSETFQLIPEETTTALVLHHPDSQQFQNTYSIE